jgi:hypothetical protein
MFDKANSLLELGGFSDSEWKMFDKANSLLELGGFSDSEWSMIRKEFGLAGREKEFGLEQEERRRLI